MNDESECTINLYMFLSQRDMNLEEDLESLHFLRYNLGLFKMILTLPVAIADEEKKLT